MGLHDHADQHDQGDREDPGERPFAAAIGSHDLKHLLRQLLVQHAKAVPPAIARQAEAPDQGVHSRRNEHEREADREATYSRESRSPPITP